MGNKGKRRVKYRKEVKKDSGKTEVEVPEVEVPEDTEQQVAASSELRLRVSKKFLLPLTNRQLIYDKSEGVRRVLQKYLEEQGSDVKLDSDVPEKSGNIDHIKIFGSINDINELLDLECKSILLYHITEKFFVRFQKVIFLEIS